jgi:hypothetical protein
LRRSSSRLRSAHECNPAPGLEQHAETVQRESVLTGVAHAHALERDRPAGRRHGTWRFGVDDRRLAVDHVEHPASRRDRLDELAGGGPERLDALERGEREQRQQRDQDAVELSIRVRGHGDGENCSNRHAGQRPAQCVPDAVCERGRPAGAREPRLGVADLRRRSFSAPYTTSSGAPATSSTSSEVSSPRSRAC